MPPNGKISKGSVFQHKDGGWGYLFYYDGARKQGRCGVGVTSRKAAWQEMDRRKYEVQTRELPGPKGKKRRPTLAAAVEKYLELKRDTTGRWNFNKTRRALTVLLMVGEPAREIDHLKTEHYLRFLRRIKDLKPISKYSYLGYVRSFLIYAEDENQGWCREGLFKVFDLPDIERPVPETISVKKVLRVCAKMKNQQAVDIVMVALYTAARKGEVLKLTRKDVDLKRWQVRFVKTKTFKPRVVPIVAALRPTMRRLVEQARDGGHEWLFPSSRRDGRHVVEVKNHLIAGSKAARIGQVLTFKVIRHTACSLLAGVAPAHVQAQIAGHSVSTAEKYYIGQYQEEKAKALRAAFARR